MIHQKKEQKKKETDIRSISNLYLYDLNAPCILSLNSAVIQGLYKKAVESGNMNILLGSDIGLTEQPARNRQVQIALIQSIIYDYWVRKEKPVLHIIRGTDGLIYVNNIHKACACILLGRQSRVKDWDYIFQDFYMPYSTADAAVRTKSPLGVRYSLLDFMKENKINETSIILPPSCEKKGEAI